MNAAPDNHNDPQRQLQSANRRAWGLQGEVARLEGLLAAANHNRGNNAPAWPSGQVPYNLHTVKARLKGVMASFVATNPEVSLFLDEAEVLCKDVLEREDDADELAPMAAAYEPAAKRLKALAGELTCPVTLERLTAADATPGKCCTHLVSDGGAAGLVAHGDTTCPECRAPGYMTDEHLALVRRARAEIEAEGAEAPAEEQASPDAKFEALRAEERIAVRVVGEREIIDYGPKGCHYKRDETDDKKQVKLYDLRFTVLLRMERPWTWDPQAIARGAPKVGAWVRPLA